MIDCSDFLKDNDGRSSMGRLVLIVGLILTFILGLIGIYYFTKISLQNVLWAWAACFCVIIALPGAIGLLAYIFSKLYDVREWLSKTIKEFKDDGTKTQ